jgi:signal transduction histidine kinase
MTQQFLSIVYFFYGLSFFSMGLGILLEIGRAFDAPLRHALRPLAVFGFVHALNEWLEMFDRLGLLHGGQGQHILWEAARMAILAFSFLSLGAFGSSLLANGERARRLSLLLPLILSALWGVGLLAMRGIYPPDEILTITDVWTRYTIAVPATIAACLGLLAQQRRFRQVGMAEFGRDTLWAAIAFFWYGVIGQTFVKPTSLPPSNLINQDLFFDLFGFPVQILRAATAGAAAFFVIRFLRAFEVETQNQITDLQEARVQEARHREEMRGELLHRVVEAQESERQRIARELHDETGQALTALGLGLRGVRGTIGLNEDKAEQRLEQMELLVDRSLNELQRLITNLRPSHLDDLGLGATLRWYAGEIESSTRLHVDVEVIGERGPMSTEIKTALFRITQEALTNIVKHANANEVVVRLVYGTETVSVRVIDDGRGFDLSVLDNSERKSWGLLGMRERANLLGGVLTIDSTPGFGSRVEVVIPYEQPAPALEAIK